ncbi:unnamed protein product, partial [Rotaria magnacalcarata]
MSASRTMNSFEHTDRKVDNRKDSPNHNDEENVRKNRAEIVAEGAL